MKRPYLPPTITELTPRDIIVEVLRKQKARYVLVLQRVEDVRSRHPEEHTLLHRELVRWIDELEHWIELTKHGPVGNVLDVLRAAQEEKP